MITAILTVIAAIRNWWKIIVAAILGIATAIFAWNYRRRGEQLEASKQAIRGLKAKEKVERKKEAVAVERVQKIKEVKDAKKNNLADRLNSVDE